MLKLLLLYKYSLFFFDIVKKYHFDWFRFICLWHCLLILLFVVCMSRFRLHYILKNPRAVEIRRRSVRRQQYDSLVLQFCLYFMIVSLLVSKSNGIILVSDLVSIEFRKVKIKNVWKKKNFAEEKHLNVTSSICRNFLNNAYIKIDTIPLRKITFNLQNVTRMKRTRTLQFVISLATHLILTIRFS